MKRDDETATRQALKLLMQDHRRIRKLIRRAEKLKRDSPEQQLAIGLACRELADHAALEERHLYPSLRAADARADVIQAQVEHDVAKQLTAELVAMGPRDERYLPTFRVLAAYLAHHIDEEETRLFDWINSCAIDLAPLAEALLERQRSGGLTDVDFESPALGSGDEASASPATFGASDDPQHDREPGRRGAH